MIRLRSGSDQCNRVCPMSELAEQDRQEIQQPAATEATPSGWP